MNHLTSRCPAVVVAAILILVTAAGALGAVGSLELEDTWIEGSLPPTLIDDLEDAVLSELRPFDVPGLMVGFRIGDQRSAVLAFGSADLGQERAMRTTDSFYIGSASKMLTATLILQLVEEGLLGLDEPASNHLFGLPAAWDSVTIRHLLEHTSGIPSYVGTASGQSLRWTSEPISYETILSIIEAMPLESIPGALWKYTNTNYYLLGHIAEAVTGATYGEILVRSILTPLGMSHSGYDPLNRPDDLVVTYRKDDEPLSEFEVYPRPNVSLVHGAGGIHSTMADMLLWIDGWADGRVLDEASLQWMQTPAHASDLPLGDSYGMGCMIWDGQDSGLPLHVGHLGNIHGNLCLPFVYPEQDLILVIYSNSYDILRALLQPVRSVPLQNRLAEILLEHVEEDGE